MDVILILFQGHTDNSQVHLLVNTFGLQAFLQDDTCLVTNLQGLLYGLCNRLDGLVMGNLLGGLHVAHQDSEECEGNP